MKAIFLSGNSIRNRSWIEELEGALHELFEETKIQYYKHWETGKEILDDKHEAKELVKNVKGWENYVVVAKSAGTYVTIKAINEKKINPVKCIFMGFPYKWLKEKGFVKEAEEIKNLKIPVLILQNSKDPFSSYDELKTLFQSKNNFELIKFENNSTHDYKDYKKLRTVIGKYLEK